MVVLTLPLTFVNNLTTGVAVSGQAAIGRSEDYAVPGEVRTYAGGRRRSITSVGEVGSYKFQLRFVSRGTVDTLHTWLGQMVEVRDTKGRRFFGTFYVLSVEEIVTFGTLRCSTTSLWHVSVELTVVTFTEEV